MCGVQLLNVSMRLLHEKRQSSLAKPFIKMFQDTLYNTRFGTWFYSQVAKPETVRNILQTAYGDKSTVTDELVDIILKPGMDPRAPPVFLAFICNSAGPLPDEQLQKIDVPVSIVWGADDPWEKVEFGRQLAQFSSVKEYTELPGEQICASLYSFCVHSKSTTVWIVNCSFALLIIDFIVYLLYCVLCFWQ